MGEQFNFDELDVFTTGTVGPPGQRIFYLQARHGTALAKLRCEKQQVAALGRYLADLLSDLPDPDDVPVPGVLDLDESAVDAWTVGPIGVAYDGSVDRFVIAAEELVPTNEEGEPDPVLAESKGSARFSLTRGQALAFARRASELLATSRPLCRFCGQPKDPEGHICPRMN
jgi:uncharacterized repeat protein (TIGR03847 family)